jgi:putative CocE/NonD family hydrolase
MDGQAAGRAGGVTISTMKPVLLAFLLVFPAFGQSDEAKKQLEYTRSHYTKFDYRIPMRDGVKLFTSVYVPKDTGQKWPMLMQRTPYSVAPYGIDNYRGVLGPSELFTKETFIFVYQDVRGRYLSEGKFVDVPTLNDPERTDTYDTIDWLVKNVPNNNGRVGQWGISYPGFYAAYGLVNAHPALKASSPQAPMGDVGNGDDAYHNGAFFLAANFGFYTMFKPRGGEPERPDPTARRFSFGTPDAFDFYLRMGPLANANERYLKNENVYWNDILKHANYDAFWADRALAPHMQHITPAVLFVGGWFDAEDLAGPVKLFRAVDSSTLVMGPWPHGGWSRLDGDKLGNLNFGSKTGEYFRKDIELPFFVAHLKGKADAKYPRAWVFETGTNQWQKFDSWPPKSTVAKTLYLGANGTLAWSAPKSNAFDEYISDPAHPVPVIGEIGEGMPSDYMTYDQRFASRRPDVLTYQTEPLDHDVTVAGPVAPNLRVATTGTDSDFIVKLIDVYPNDYPESDSKVHMPGYQQLVRGEPFRGKFRNSMTKPEPFAPGKETEIQFVMPDVCHTFRPGHRIMVQIQSSWFPLVDRNPQQFVNIPGAKASDFRKATERVYHGSGLKLMVIE